jgi:hypothetical protein
MDGRLDYEPQRPVQIPDPMRRLCKKPPCTMLRVRDARQESQYHRPASLLTLGYHTVLEFLTWRSLHGTNNTRRRRTPRTYHPTIQHLHLAISMHVIPTQPWDPPNPPIEHHWYSPADTAPTAIPARRPTE